MSVALVEDAEILLTGLTVPPSLNHAYVNVPGLGRVASQRLTKWKKVCGWEIRAQRQQALRGPVHLAYTFAQSATKADLGNLEKAATDLLVELKLIDGDSKKTVRSIRLQWGDVQGMQIEVRAA